jgi:hypothetical protein
MRRFALLPLIGLIFAFAPTVHAANAVVGTGTPGSCTETALRDAVIAANSGGGTITFNCGGAAHTIFMTQQIRFTTQGASYTLDGGGLITLDGQDATRLIYTLSGRNLSLTVKNIALNNGYATGEPSSERAQNQGGAIYSGYENTLTVQNVIFTGNRAQAQHYKYHGGGAIAIDTTSVVTITDSVFIDNRAPNGGAINNLLSRLTITRSLFRDNRATRADPGGGGAIYNDAGKLTIKDSHILDNVSANLGGGIFSWANDVNGSYSGPTVIKNTVLDGNSAEHGGGLWKGGAYVLKLTNSSVTNNTATNGGAGLSGTGPGKNFTIVNSTIAYNATTPAGTAGGIFSANNSSTIKNSTIAFNTIPDDTVGAAIHGDVTLTNTILLGNTGGWNGIWACAGNIVNGGNNIQHPGDTCGGVPTKHAKLELTLQPARDTLAFGQTQTLAPLLDSPAVNKGANCPATDQRGVARPQGAQCDIGAHELQGSKPPLFLITAPAPNATSVPLQPVITWGAAGNTVSYIVTVVQVSNSKQIVKATVAGTCSPTCSYNVASSGKSLKPGKDYVLKVQARNPFGRSNAKLTFQTAQ